VANISSKDASQFSSSSSRRETESVSLSQRQDNTAVSAGRHTDVKKVVGNEMDEKEARPPKNTKSIVAARVVPMNGLPLHGVPFFTRQQTRKLETDGVVIFRVSRDLGPSACALPAEGKLSVWRPKFPSYPTIVSTDMSDPDIYGRETATLGHLLPSSTVKKMTLKDAAVATRMSSRALQAAFPGFNEQRFVANISEAGLFWEKVAVSSKHSADGSVTGREPCLQYTRKPAVYETDLFYPSDVFPRSADGLSRSPGDPMFAWQAPRLVPSSRLASPRILNHLGMAQACTTYEGITSNMLYRGSLGTMFRWHVEDSMLPSVSYCQLGKPKVWWVLPAHQRTLVKAQLLKYIDPFVLTAADGNIWDVLASKRLFFPPKVFQEHGVQVTRAKRHAGDFIVTATGALHSGMNLRVKLMSATNFPTPSWWRLGIEHGACARELGRHVPYPLEKMIIQPSQQLVAGKWWWGDANILKACDPENFFMDVKEAEKFVSE